MSDAADTSRPIAVHPLAELLPEMANVEREALQEDIKKNGQLEPIMINNKSLIIDGRHRYRCCIALGIKPRFERRDISEDKVLSFILSVNVHRRHLSTSQRAATGCDVFERRSENFPITQAEVAKRFNISDRSLRDAIAIKRASPELHEALRADAVTINTAKPIAELPEAQRKDAVKKLLACGDKTTAKKLGKIKRTENSKLEMPGLLGEWSTLLHVLNNLAALPVALRDLPDRLGERPLSPKHAAELKRALRPVITMDLADLVAATREAIAVLDTIIKDEPIEDRPAGAVALSATTATPIA